MKKISLLALIAAVLMSCSLFKKDLDGGKTAPRLGEVIVTDITSTSAVLTSSLISSGSYSILERGFSYGPETKPYETGYAIAADVMSGNDFSATVTDLEDNTTYYVTPYVKVGDEKYYVGTSQEISFTTKVQGDYSSARVSSDNRDVEIALRSCYRNGTRVKIEATILNKGIQPYDVYAMYMNNQGYKLGNLSYISHVEDDQYSDYADDAVIKTLNNKSSQYELRTQLPVGSTKILSIVVDGVPANAKKISVYIATRFYNTMPEEYAYLTFENVPIY